MSSDYASIYELLDLARERPAMYGIGGKSLRQLNAFLAGLSYADLKPGDPPFWDFWTWGMVFTGRSAHNTRPLSFLEELPDADGYAAWFQLLDEYRKCRVVELARLPGSAITYRSEWTGELDQPRELAATITPDAIRVAQYAPSNIFLAEQIFPDHTKKLLSAVQPSLKKAIEAAEREWQVDPAAWGLPVD